MSKILTLDIETSPAKVYVWSLWRQNIGLNQVVTPGGVICVGAKWMGKKKTYLFSDWKDGHVAMLRKIRDMIAEADAVITYNGKKFDLPKLMGEFAQYGIAPPPPPTMIDVWLTARSLGLLSSKLAFVGPAMGVGGKMAHQGFDLWVGVMEGDKACQKKMAEYCIQDVVMTEALYTQIKPYITNHPRVSDALGACPACQSTNLTRQGVRRTRMFRVQRLQCQDCGSWTEGSRKKIG